MMTEQKISAGNSMGDQEAHDSICFAALPDDIVVVRISGRGTFHNSMELRRLADAIVRQKVAPAPQFIVDLENCITMDSTFMGVLASIGLRQLKQVGKQLVVANANQQNVRLLTTLGLTQFITVRQCQEDALRISDDEFQCMIREDVSRTDRIVHMIEAHRDLCQADPSNNLRFESVLKYLNDSLENEPK